MKKQTILSQFQGCFFGIAIGDALGADDPYQVRGPGNTCLSIEQAIELPESYMPVEEAILQMGQDWVGEEALGIAIYCALRFSEHWSDGALAAANMFSIFQREKEIPRER